MSPGASTVALTLWHTGLNSWFLWGLRTSYQRRFGGFRGAPVQLCEETFNHQPRSGSPGKGWAISLTVTVYNYHGVHVNTVQNVHLLVYFFPHLFFLQLLQLPLIRGRAYHLLLLLSGYRSWSDVSQSVAGARLEARANDSENAQIAVGAILVRECIFTFLLRNKRHID